MNAVSRIRQFPASPEPEPAETLPPIDDNSGEISRFAAIREKLKFALYDYREPITKPPVVYRLNGVTIATKGNIVALKGPEKVGKTAVIGAAIASAIAGEPEHCDLLGFQTTNPEGHLMLVVDCEQSDFHHAQMMQSVMTRARRTDMPSWVKAYKLRGFSHGEILDALECALEDGYREFGGVHSVWADGFGDMVLNVNDGETCVGAVSRLMALSKKFNTVVFGVVHQNPGSQNDKARGVLGSELQRKCETILALERSADCVEIYTALSRNGPIKKGDGLRFTWDDPSRMFRTDQVGRERVMNDKRQRLAEIAGRVLPVGAEIGYNELKGAIAVALDVSDGGAKTKIREMVALNVVQKTADGKYAQPASESGQEGKQGQNRGNCPA